MIKQKNNSTGFTIIELIVILLIIGILTSILALTYSGIRQRQNNNDRIADIKLISAHLETYYAENGKYPTFADLNSPTWRATNLKGLDEGSIKDPGNKSPDPTFASTPAKNQYAYQPAAGNNAACDNKTVACVKYVLTATLTGNSGTFVQDSLNN